MSSPKQTISYTSMTITDVAFTIKFPKLFVMKIKNTAAGCTLPQILQSVLFLMTCMLCQMTVSARRLGKSVAPLLLVILWFNGRGYLWPYLFSQKPRQARKHVCGSLGQGLLNFITPGLEMRHFSSPPWDLIVKLYFNTVMWRHNRLSK